MSELESPSALELILEIGRPMFYGFMAISPVLLIGGSSTPGWLYGVTGVLNAATTIWCIVRWINRQDDPRVNRPTPAPDSPPDFD